MDNPDRYSTCITGFFDGKPIVEIIRDDGQAWTFIGPELVDPNKEFNRKESEKNG